MICISGIPCTGKTSICRMLNDAGIECKNLDNIALEYNALNNGIVDMDSLIDINIDIPVVESHYSHILDCEYIIIIKDDENKVRERMIKRGYSNNKINENIDAQRSDIIYYESLDHMPENRIYIIDGSGMNIEELFLNVYNLILTLNKKVN